MSSNMQGPDRSADQQVFDAFAAFIVEQDDAAIESFKDNLRAWGSEWRPVEPSHGVASDQLGETLEVGLPEAARVVAQFFAHRATRHWEQTYSAADGVVGEDMLSSYGFAEIVGPRGPFVSTAIRGGLGLYGPHITYPLHRHGPDEVYVVISGSAEFTVDGDVSARRAGDIVHVLSMTQHGFTTGAEPLVVLYLWQDGSLRETSTF